MSINLALQLFSLRDYKPDDFKGVLRDVKSAGYDGVEFAGFHDLTAKELRSSLDSLGLMSEGSHTDIGLISKNIDQVIEDNLTLGTRYIIIPGASLNSEDDYLKLAELCCKAGEKVKKAGMNLLYHNHSQEFTSIFGDKRGLEILRDNTPADALKFQLDVFWVQHAGQDPLQIMDRFGNRCATVHLKDMNNAKEKAMTEVGTGIVDIGGVIRKGKKMGFEWFTVEQDEITIDKLKSVAISAENTRKIEAKQN